MTAWSLQLRFCELGFDFAPEIELNLLAFLDTPILLVFCCLSDRPEHRNLVGSLTVELAQKTPILQAICQFEYRSYP
jgi:hypothetical protein